MAKKKNFTKQVSFRLNFLFLITFLLFSALILKLGLVQIVQGEEYLRETERNSLRKISVESPRGWIMDRNGEILVKNSPVYTVTYTDNNVPTEQKEEVAQKLSQYIDLDEERILREMNRGMAFTPQRIKQELTPEEMFRVSEHLHELPGVDVMVDPIREYPHGNLFSTYIGKVGPIQADKLDYYLSKGYRMNEYVGISYLEQQYEEQLRGNEGTIELYLDKFMRPTGDPSLTPGQRGNDLVLTIDYKLQQKIEEVIDRAIEEDRNVSDIPHEQPLFVMMDPHTGEVLGMSNNVYTYSVGSYAPGSIVKMATVLMGLHEGIVTPNTVINDRPITFADGTRIGSWRVLGNLNAYTALQRSSNIYMVQIGLRMANFNQGRYFRKEAFDEIYYYFSQFGLGVPTGIDLPNESPGLRPTRAEDFNLGRLAHYTFGQRDQYTPMQLAQYVSTIANGGYRMQPYLVKEMRRGVPLEEELNQIVMKKEPTILNKIEMSDEHLAVVQRGMELVTSPGGTAYGVFGSFPVKVAAKTGTAETERNGISHTTFVGYAPADNPQIAFACIVPYSGSSNQSLPAPAQVITREILEYYFSQNE